VDWLNALARPNLEIKLSAKIARPPLMEFTGLFVSRVEHHRDAWPHADANQLTQRRPAAIVPWQIRVGIRRGPRGSRFSYQRTQALQRAESQHSNN
jgi:hypothetical protein